MPSKKVSRHFQQPPRPTTNACLTAHSVLCKAFEACENFHVIFRGLRENAGRGTTKDGEQDILRAMLVFSCAGLDSALKQLVGDALADVIERDKGAQENFTESVKRKLPDIERSRDLLASVLTAGNPRAHLIERLMLDLQADSLQSVAQLSKVAAAFNIKSSEIGNISSLKEVFEARNQIIHEMDIDFRANRSRHSRTKADMERLTKVALDAAASLLLKVDQKLQS